MRFFPIQTWEWRDRNKDLLALGFRPFWLWGYSSDSEMRILSMPDEKAWQEEHHPVRRLDGSGWIGRQRDRRSR